MLAWIQRTMFTRRKEEDGGEFEKPQLPFYCPNERTNLLDDLDSHVEKLDGERQVRARERVRYWKDAIQPHTDEGGDAYYIGDAYESINPVCYQEWSVSNPSPYLQYVKSLSKELPHLEYLAHWMEVTAAPPKWRFIRRHPENRQERAKRTKVCLVEYEDHKRPRSELFDSTPDLREALEAREEGSGQVQARLLIVEDLSRDLVSMLGEHYDIDPLFFLSHISDYLFHNTRDRWVELPELDVESRKSSHFNLQYLRPRYFKSEESFELAERQSGIFNVLRRLDSDRSRKRLQNGLLDLPDASVTLTRAKTSFWLKPAVNGEPITAILLVDPTVTEGIPLWGGYRPFSKSPSMKQWQHTEKVEGPPHTTLFDDVVYWCSRTTQADLDTIKTTPRHLANPMYMLVVADWLCVLKYITTMLGKLEWEFEKPHWGEKPSDIDGLLKKLSPWRRNICYYQNMISEAISRLFPHALHSQLDPLGEPSAQPTLVNPKMPRDDERGVLALWTDFKTVKQKMNETQARIKSIETMATNAINTEEARRAVKQNKNLARLTFLATIFIPLNFTSSFLSMSPSFGWSSTIWIFFAIGIPITLGALIVVDLTHPTKKGLIHQYWRQHKPKAKAQEVRPHHNVLKSQPSESDFDIATQKSTPTASKRTKTIPWIATRNNTAYIT